MRPGFGYHRQVKFVLFKVEMNRDAATGKSLPKPPTVPPQNGCSINMVEGVLRKKGRLMVFEPVVPHNWAVKFAAIGQAQG